MRCSEPLRTPWQPVISIHRDDNGVELWFRAQPGVTESSIESWNGLAPNLGRRGWPGERELAIAIERFYGETAIISPVETLFDMIRLDENHPLPKCRNQPSTTKYSL